MLETCVVKAQRVIEQCQIAAEIIVADNGGIDNAASPGFHSPEPILGRLFRYINLEAGLLPASILSIVGLTVSVYAVSVWDKHAFGPLDYSETLHMVIPAALYLTLGAQTILDSFFLSVLGMRRR